MTEYIAAVTSAIALAKQAREIGTALKHAELKNIIGDLSMQLADVKIGMADLIEENYKLKKQLESIQNADGESCPRCRQRSYVLADSVPHPIFGQVGGVVRTYKCPSCGFSESSTILPE